jgi:hypothetical protein
VCGHPLQERRSSNIEAEDKRQFVWIQPGPEVGVDEIDADRLGFDQDLARARGRPRSVNVVEGFWAAVLGDFDGVYTAYFHRDTKPPSMAQRTRIADRRCNGEQTTARCAQTQHGQLNAVTLDIDGRPNSRDDHR